MSILKDIISKCESFIEKDRNYNPSGLVGTVGDGMRQISSTVLTLKNLVATIGDAPDTDAIKDVLQNNVAGLLELTKKIQDASKINPDAKLDEILNDDEYKRYVEITSQLTYAEVRNHSLPLVEEYLASKGIPFFKIASASRASTYIVTSQEYAPQMGEMRRVLAINEKYGLSDVAEFSTQERTGSQMKISNLETWEAELLNKIMKEERISGGIAFKSSTLENAKCDIVYRAEDDVVMQKVLLRAEMIKKASLSAKADLILINKLKGQAKDRFLLAKAIQLSQFTNFYICSESIDKYIELNKSGFTLYVDGKPTEVVKRDQMSEEEFTQKFNDVSNNVRNFNMVILQDSNFKESKEDALAKMKTQKGRKLLMKGLHPNNIDYATYDSSMIDQLKRFENMPFDELMKYLQGLKRSGKSEDFPFIGSVFVYQVCSKYLDTYKTTELPCDVQDLLYSDSEPSLLDIVQNIKNYAVAYAKSEQFREWCDNTPQSIKEQNYKDNELQDETSRILNNVLDAQNRFKSSIDAVKKAYNIPNEIMNEFINGIALMAGAEINLNDPNNTIVFSGDLEFVETLSTKFDNLQKDMISLSTRFENVKGEQNMSSIDVAINEHSQHMEDITKDQIETYR